jgi:hypothetical protein
MKRVIHPDNEARSRVQAAIEMSDASDEDFEDIAVSDWLDDSGEVDDSHVLSVELS